MNNTVWFNDPTILFDSKQVLEFWPNKNQSPAERINNSSRFIIYATVVAYLIKRDVRLFYLCVLLLCVLYILHNENMIKERPLIADGQEASILRPSCQQPTRTNPLANVLLSDYTDDPNRPSACFYPTVKNQVKEYLDDTFSTDSPNIYASQTLASRAFYSTPSTTIPNDQTAFAEACYGAKNRPLCRDDPSVCDPNARGVQLEAFAGLNSASDPRTGMFGGTV